MNARNLGTRLIAIAALNLLWLAAASAMENAKFDSGNIAAGQTFTWKATPAGEFGYKDKLNANHLGEILVQAGDGMGKTTEVEIRSAGFSPNQVTVLKDSTVRWTNKDSTAHTVTESPEALAMLMEKDKMAKDDGGFLPGPGLGLVAAVLLGAAVWARRSA